MNAKMLLGEVISTLSGGDHFEMLHIISAVKEIRQQSVWCYNARSCQNPKPSDIDSTLLFTFDLDEAKVLHANDAQFLCSAKAGPQIEWLLSDYQSCRVLIW
jgi:hypothetical protein